MKSSIYKFIIYAVCFITVGFSIFLITSDNISPFTTQATIHKTIANIAPEVSGVITEVNIKNGQDVKAGDKLFSINSQNYQLDVQSAEAELHSAQELDSAKWQELKSASQSLIQRNLEWDNAQTKYARSQRLLSKGLLNEQDFDESHMNASIAKSAVEAANAEVLRIKAELSNKNKSSAIEIAETALAKAKLDLIRTNVTAQFSGTISNLQLQSGSYVNKGSVSLFMINEESTWLSADFNEKGIVHLQAGANVWITFDAIPGQVFSGQITNQDRAIFDSSTSTSQLSAVTNDSRWIREQQKIRTRIHIKDANTALIAGSRASVIVSNGNTIIDTIGYTWIKLVAWFRYIY
ncbi:HlyD family secretion protein [Moritella sp. Urea-trap-13]|nr:HlyD family secretion protein [Moritella sp. Urea-trap-13]